MRGQRASSWASRPSKGDRRARDVLVLLLAVLAVGSLIMTPDMSVLDAVGLLAIGLGIGALFIVVAAKSPVPTPLSLFVGMLTSGLVGFMTPGSLAVLLSTFVAFLVLPPFVTFRESGGATE